MRASEGHMSMNCQIRELIVINLLEKTLIY